VEAHWREGSVAMPVSRGPCEAAANKNNPTGAARPHMLPLARQPPNADARQIKKAYHGLMREVRGRRGAAARLCFCRARAGPAQGQGRGGG
jgi:hypothetical protein